MKKFIKTTDNAYSYINVDLIVEIDYTPIENRWEQYKNDPVYVTMANGIVYKISNEDAEELIGIKRTEKENGKKHSR